MHLVFINQYYPPDAAPTGVVLEDLAAAMVRKGHRVTVLCATGVYAGGRDGVTQPSEASTSGGPAALDEMGRMRKSAPTILRIGATSFGRRSFTGKLLDYGSYYVGVTWKLLTMHPRPDRIVALTTPPYLSVVARAASKLRGADHAHWVMDLYPDVMLAHGMLANNSWSHLILDGLARWGFGGGRCAQVLTLGPDMAARIEILLGTAAGRKSEIAMAEHSTAKAPASQPDAEEVGAENRKAFKIQNPKSKIISWVPLWGTVERNAAECGAAENDPAVTSGLLEAAALREKRGWHSGDLVVMYSGNMGLGHRFGEILAAARTLADLSDRDQDGLPKITDGAASRRHAGDRTRFVFFGAGKRRDEILEFRAGHPSCGVEMHDYAPAAILEAHLLSADVHVVSLNPEWTGTMVPSKLQGIFTIGRPVIFIGSEASSIGRWVIESGGGWVVGPGDVKGLLAALVEARDANHRTLRGQAALAYAKVHFAREINVARVAELFERMTTSDYPKV